MPGYAGGTNICPDKKHKLTNNLYIMKKNIYTLAIALMLGGLFLSSCGTQHTCAAYDSLKVQQAK
jgi:hypothetical protein